MTKIIWIISILSLHLLFAIEKAISDAAQNSTSTQLSPPTEVLTFLPPDKYAVNSTRSSSGDILGPTKTQVTAIVISLGIILIALIAVGSWYAKRLLKRQMVQLDTFFYNDTKKGNPDKA